MGGQTRQAGTSRKKDRDQLLVVDGYENHHWADSKRRTAVPPSLITSESPDLVRAQGRHVTPVEFLIAREESVD